MLQYVGYDDPLKRKKMTRYIISRENLIRHVVQFESLVRSRDNNPDKKFSFADTDRVLGNEEYYKTQIAKQAKEILRYGEWGQMKK